MDNRYEDRTARFKELAARFEAGRFDDDFLKLLIPYWEEEDDADANIFYAGYAFSHKDYDTALHHAEKAYRMRRVNIALWRILRDCYFHFGEIGKAFFFLGLLSNHYGEPIAFSLPHDVVEENLPMLSFGMGWGNYAPMLQKCFRLTEDGLSFDTAICAGRFLPSFYSTDSLPFFVGAYATEDAINQNGLLLDAIKDNASLLRPYPGWNEFDIMKASEAPAGTPLPIHVAGRGLILPVAGTEASQRLAIDSTETSHFSSILGKWETSFFRLTSDASLSSDHPFIVGKPIPLGHSPKRKKVVINILLDALCWRMVRERDYDIVPNIIRFFSKGTIFNDHHSVGEYTFPSLHVIDTGRYPHHTQTYSEFFPVPLSPDTDRLSTQVATLGYYPTKLMSSGDTIYTELSDGYDRILTESYYQLPISEGVERTISQLDAFDEVDNFIYIHALDTHAVASHLFHQPLGTQTHASLTERASADKEKVTSVHLKKHAFYMDWNLRNIRKADRYLGTLFDYLESHYDDNEYLITLYSDHGTSIYDEKIYLLSDSQTGAAFMMRGAGVPALGLVEEMTSAIDIYPCLAHFLGFETGDIDGCLPAAFGGKERGYAVSYSIYPGHPFDLCIHGKEYEYRLQSRRIVDEDGRVDFSDADDVLYRRGTEEEVTDPSLLAHYRSITAGITDGIDSHGRQWPEMRNKRPEWFEEFETQKQV